MEELKRVENPGQFLSDTGLLYEINRRVLHPFGLALEIIKNTETGDVNIGGIWDYRDCEEGIEFQHSEQEIGEKKYWKFIVDHGIEKLLKRYEALGSIHQGCDFPVQVIEAESEV